MKRITTLSPALSQGSGSEPTQAPVLLECPVAGFQYGDGHMCWHLLRLHDPLTLRRESGNPHDTRAVRVYWNTLALGYVPREANYAIAQMLDRGELLTARVSGLQACTDPWKRVRLEILWSITPSTSPEPPATKPAAPPLRPTSVLVQSLARRVFGSRFSPGEAAWAESHAASLALVGVERPEFLPFLRLVFARGDAAPAADPPDALKSMLAAAGMDPAAFRHLRHWRFATFEELGEGAIDAASVAGLANLLLQLEVHGGAPPAFVGLAASLARYRAPAGASMDFGRLPLWFMRALFLHVEDDCEGSPSATLRSEVFTAADWLLDTAPSPDANQQRAGWRWIQARAREHTAAQRRAATPEWHIPFRERTIGRRWIVPIRNFAELAAEALAMKNCLRDYELDCGSGLFAVYSIRDALTGDRAACFAVECEAPGAEWTLVEVAGKANAEVDQELRLLAEAFIELAIHSGDSQIPHDEIHDRARARSAGAIPQRSRAC